MESFDFYMVWGNSSMYNLHDNIVGVGVLADFDSSLIHTFTQRLIHTL